MRVYYRSDRLFLYRKNGFASLRVETMINYNNIFKITQKLLYNINYYNIHMDIDRYIMLEYLYT